MANVSGGGTPSRSVASYWNGGIPWASVKDFEDGVLALRSTQERITREGLANSAANLVPAGTVVVCTRMAVGRAAMTTEPTAINQDLKALFPTSSVEPGFLLRVIDHARPTIEARAIGSTVRGISVTDLLSTTFQLPSLPEQRRIADILDTVDAALQQTEALIAKLKQARAGLLHDLLTRGVDEHGQLRDPQAHSEQFKDSPLGRVPREWTVYQLDDLVPRAEYGISVSLDDPDGIPVLRMNNLKDGEVDMSDLKRSNRAEARQLLLRPMDVLFNRTNSIEHVGRTAIWRGQADDVSFASYLVRLNPNRARLNPEYLAYWLNLPASQLQMRRYATPGVHQVNINPTNLRKMSLAVPSTLSEQETIVESVAAHDASVRTDESYRDKLRQLKQGLMDDLLTGRVRVGHAEMLGARA